VLLKNANFYILEVWVVLMTKKFKVISMTIIIILIVFMASKYLLDFLFEDMCGNDIKQKIPSPSGKSVAYIFERSCGATTGFSPQLSIINKDDEFQNESGNTFRSDKDFSIERKQKCLFYMLNDNKDV
jgi:hypothetical protein